METKDKIEVDLTTALAPEIDIFAEKDAEIIKLREERDNYRNAALARKGKLPADSEILGDDFESFIEEKVKTVLADKELARRETEKENEITRIRKENSELRLAMQNRPNNSMGGSGGGSNVEVKDSVFSAAQITELTMRAQRLKIDPVKFIENTKANIARRN